MKTTDVVRSNATPLDASVALWLHEKFTRSQSRRTLQTYERTIAEFRANLAYVHADLDSAPALITTRAQIWASANTAEGLPVAPTTVNQRLAILSSFYTFARRRHLLPHADNPIELIGRARVESYAGAHAFSPEAVIQKVSAIDQSTLSGARDYALLVVGFTTGRRLSELAAMRYQDLTIEGTKEQPKVTITFPRAKGRKEMRDTLGAGAAHSLLAYLARRSDLIADAPVWVSFSNNGSAGKALHARTIGKICQRYLGTSKVHTLRHTFAQGMEKAGASVSDIQRRLGHSNLAVTSTYLAKLRSDENAYADALGELFGFKRP